MTSRLHLRRAGFTLIELLVVLVILAALSTVALRSVHGLQDRARFEATTQRLEDIEAALLGSRSGLPGDVRAGGLIADTGRFLTETVADPTMRLADLLQQPAGFASSSFLTDSVDMDVRLATGWRGPYIRVQTGLASSLQIEDAWGNPIAALFDTTTSNWSAVSSGADGVFGSGIGYDSDIAIRLPAAIEKSLVEGEVTITEEAETAIHDAFLGIVSLEVRIYAFEPNPANGSVFPVSVASKPFNPEDLPASVAFAFPTDSALSTGPRLFRAYVFDPLGTATEPRSSPVSSSILSVNLLHGAQTLNLTIDR